MFRELTEDELLSYYRAAQIALITPLKDGMNLVAKEYCAASPDEDCVLILSEFAGAAAEMRNGALTVNPYDIEAVADAIHRAFRMPADERRARMRRLRRCVRRHDVYSWVESFLRAAVREWRERGTLERLQGAPQDATDVRSACRSDPTGPFQGGESISSTWKRAGPFAQQPSRLGVLGRIPEAQCGLPVGHSDTRALGCPPAALDEEPPATPEHVAPAEPPHQFRHDACIAAQKAVPIA